MILKTLSWQPPSSFQSIISITKHYPGSRRHHLNPSFQLPNIPPSSFQLPNIQIPKFRMDHFPSTVCSCVLHANAISCRKRLHTTLHHYLNPLSQLPKLILAAAVIISIHHFNYQILSWQPPSSSQSINSIPSSQLPNIILAAAIIVSIHHLNYQTLFWQPPSSSQYGMCFFQSKPNVCFCHDKID